MILTGLALVPVTLLIAIAVFAPLRQRWPGRPSFGRIVTLFLAGILAFLPLMVLDAVILMLLGSQAEGVWRGIEAGLTEEAVKLAILLFLTSRLKGVATPYSGMLCGLVVGLGFAVGENLIYAAFTSDPLASSRAVMAIPGHASFGVIMGYSLSRAANSHAPVRFIALAYALPAALHVLHNVCVHFQQQGGVYRIIGAATDLGALTLALVLIGCNQPAGLRGKLRSCAWLEVWRRGHHHLACPLCHAPIAAIRGVCPRCGALLAMAAASKGVANASIDVASVLVAQPPHFCGACGARTPGPHLLCRRCGSPSTSPSSERVLTMAPPHSAIEAQRRQLQHDSTTVE